MSDTAIQRALVVEDEALLAMEIAQWLADAGFVVVGPATTVARALKLIGEPGCDIAILDVNLGKEHSEPVALELKARRIPFVVVSGNAREHFPEGFQDAPSLSKPIQATVLVSLLRTFLGSDV